MPVSCINKNSVEYQSLKSRADIPEFVLESICRGFLDRYGRFPHLDELPNSNSESFFRKLFRVKDNGGTKISTILENTGLEDIESSNAVINDEYRDLEVKIIPIDEDAIVEVTHRPTENNFDNWTEEDEILSKAPRNSEGLLLAPNGKVSNLTELLYVLVRTRAFKNWFGDWINNPDEASKVVDENGEPLVVYHTTSGDTILKGEANFAIFNSNYESKTNSSLFYFTDNKQMSESYFDDNRVWKSVDEIKEKRNKYLELQNKLKSKLKLSSIQLIEEIAKHFNQSVEEYVKDLGFDSINDFINQNKRYYTKEGIIEQIKELQIDIDLLDKFIDNHNLLNPTRAFFINERNPFIVDGKGYNWNELAIDDTDIKKAVEYNREKDNYRNKLIDEAIKKIFPENYDVINKDELIEMLPEGVFKDIEEQVNNKYDKIYNIESTRSIENKIKDTNYDGMLVKNVKDWGSFSWKIDRSKIKLTGTVVSVKFPNQIKSATSNSGSFNRFSRNIYDPEPNGYLVLSNAIHKLGSLYGISFNEITSAELNTDKWRGVIPDANIVNAFIYNGLIYINIDNADLDAPIHEMFHLFIGSIRFSNPKLYSELVLLVELFPNYNLLVTTYPNRTRNDVNEEIFVTEVSKYLLDLPSNLSNLPENIRYELNYNIKRVLDSILMGLDSVKTIPEEKLYNLSLKDIADLVNSSVMVNEFHGTLDISNSEMHRKLNNTKADLFRKNELIEQCE